jgi:hydroxypyruvate isomerase
MPRFAANLSMMFTEVPFLDRFARARAAGFAAVEFLFPYEHPAEEIATRLRDNGLQQVLFNAPPGDWAAGERGIACHPARVGEFQDSVGLALDYARALGVPRLHCMAGIVPPGLDPAQARATYLDNLRFAARALAPHGIELLIEPINTYDMPGYFLTGSRQAEQVIADCAEPNLFLQYDIYHMQRMEGELANTMRRLLPLIRHVQLADTPGRHEPGTGEIAYPFLFRLLDELGYAGHVGCEYIPTSAGFAWRDALI